MMSAWIAAPLAVAVVFSYFTIRLVLLRQRRVAPGPADPGLRDEPPAVVNLLISRLVDAPQVASATLLDLAARKIIDLHEVAADAEHTLVRLGDRELSRDAPDYERRVVDRVAEVAGRTFTPVARLVERYADGGRAWQRRLVREAVLDARRRGLVTSSDVGCGLGIVAAALAGAALLAPLVPRSGQPHAGTIVVVLVGSWVLGSLILGWLMANVGLGEKATSPDRYTAKGREATAHWLGVASWLRSHDTLRDLPPGAVAVWDRYLAYGVALDAMPNAVRVLDLETVGQRSELTSSHTGTPRTVRVRYWSTNRFLRPVGPVTARATRTWSLLTLPLWIGVGIAAATTIESTYLRGLVVAFAGLQAVRASYRLGRAILDIVRPIVVTGTVLDISVAHRQRSADHNGPSGEPYPDLPTHFFVVVDDGLHDVVRPWIVNRDVARATHEPGPPPMHDPVALAKWTAHFAQPAFAVGDLLRVVGERRSRFAIEVARRRRPADQPGERTVDGVGQVG